MWFHCRPEQLAFAEHAPRRVRVTARVAASRSAVFAAVVDPGTWPHWFPGVHAASYESGTPYGIGTIRQAHVGRSHWVEELIAWDTNSRWAYTVLRSTVPLARAQIEVFDFREAEGGTEVEWTLALEPRLLARLGTPFMPSVVNRLFRRAMHDLESFIHNQKAFPRDGFAK